MVRKPDARSTVIYLGEPDAKHWRPLDMRPFQSLPPAARRAAFESLIEYARMGVHEGWEPHELPEYVKAWGRSLGFTLAPADAAAVIAAA
jgi:hypothetical protein